MTETKQPHVFLCHASEDKPVVRKLYKRLIKDGIDAWLDEEKLLPGQDWELEISRAVKNSDAIIVCLSSLSVNKAGFVQKEIKLALDVAKEKPEGAIYFIPVKIDECTVPDSLRTYQWVNLFDDRGYERIKQALKTRFDLPEAKKSTFSDKNASAYLKSAQVTIIIEKDILKFTDKEKDGFVYAISKLTGVSSNQIRVLQVSEGSVVITLEMPETGAKRLMELYYANDTEIEKLSISKITIKLDNEPKRAPQVEKINTNENLLKLDSSHININVDGSVSGSTIIIGNSNQVKQTDAESTDSKNYDVFFSYSILDKDEVRKIVDFLAKKKVSVFLSEKNIQTDTNEEITKDALRNSKLLCILVSPNSLTSEWVKAECDAAWILDIPVLPILYQCTVQSLPKNLQRYQVIDSLDYEKIMKT